MSVFRIMADTLTVSKAVTKNERARGFHSYNRNYAKLEQHAAKVAVRVENGELDPVAAEDELDTMWSQFRRDHINRPQTESVTDKVSQALSRLVEIDGIDPVAAENMLDDGLSLFSYETANHINKRYDN